ncbi:SAM-dependent DNA methyltransferase [Halorubrum sp. BOL3-1]|uniref:N-6 DNA methylase n=1 Tax=Halorubrum sp. BOL3-1 TaxID=2497325 RepID=UPI0010050324|nr:N-6 DNA methylase [Halorubrum sp. BOL3-1]QAU11665.1 SAM-dependent DNA methyltransferase [Halorubrum sp. BOL3-1]
MSAKEAEFHGILFTRLLDYIQDNETLFNEPVSEKTVDNGFADIYLPSVLNGELVIEVKRDDIYPRDKEVIKQARTYTDDLGAEFFATCNSNDLFLFHYQGEIELADIDFYYFNLRESELNDVIPQLLGVVEHVHEAQSLPDQTERDRLVGILRSFHSSIWPTYRELARQKYGSNERFTQQFDEWVQENDYGDLDDDEKFEVAGKQYAYLLTNKVLFYEVIREKTKGQYDPEVGETVTEIETKSGFELDPLHGHTTLSTLETHLQNQFETIIEEIDYEPIFDDGASLFADFPQNRKTLRTLEDFLENIEAESITRLDEDLLGEIYEELIPAEERKMLGQYYTPPKIAETLASWAVPDRSPDEIPRVLDPASGSGTFTVEAYKQLDQLPSQPSHQAIVDHLVAVDINKFPLHLTALNVASQNVSEKTDRIHTHNDSFFNLSPDVDALFSSKVHADDDGEVGLFDAAIGNPPYIDQRRLYPDKEHFRRHLKELGPQGSSVYYDGDKRFSKRCDAYIYFITHATQFLKDDGRLGYIVPTKWMMTGYGEEFQEFLHDNYKIRAVVAFGARAFQDAFVDGALLMIERCDDEEERRKNVVNFIRVKGSMEAEDIVDTVEYELDLDGSREMMILTRDSYRTVAVSQEYLMERESSKLGHFVSAPQEFIELLENSHVTSLENLLEDSSRGVTTGDNDFFLIDEEDAEARGIDDRFLTPVIRWIKQMEPQSKLTKDSTDVYLLDINDYVEEVKSGGSFGQSDLEERVKSQLRDDGHMALWDYIREGEAQGVNEKRTCASRDVWFNVGELERADILHPKGFKYRLFCLRNADSLAANNRLYRLHPARGVDTKVLLGVLNSTVYQAAVETLGRSEGRGMLELSKGDLVSLPVLDVRKLDDGQKQDIRDAFVQWESGVDGAQDELDEVILDIMGVETSVEELQELRETATQERNDRGTTSEVMVERVDTLEDVGTNTFTVGTGEADEAELSDFM